ncbi:hypothetical protein [Clostridium folliculivorans]|uniref:Uncharacterized protein n=1 Tax=Clostridium folliculivorans TaxID=2886038 RepID=A0A9W5Y1R4_9CLOT|nr:hypothetical protein [Clostridium folliculivorans]GKU24912.1 hypothetical protein CFOLD11_17380 [Clostridium folliculivorans]GKU31010.1 hypothetical protein CFB3_31170 [Clostridium folliculivorans]
MSTINGISSSWYTNGATQVSNSSQLISKVRRSNYEEQDAYQSNFDAVQASQNVSFTNPLESLVSSGTITEDQKTAIQDAFNSSMKLNVAGTYGSRPTNPISKLVSSGVISQNQADSIKETFKNISKSHMHHKRPEGISNIDEKLSGLVSDGTISEDQQTSVINAFKSLKENSNTSESKFEDPLDSLVESGTITEAQKDSIMNILVPPMRNEGNAESVYNTTDDTTVASIEA